MFVARLWKNLIAFLALPDVAFASNSSFSISADFEFCKFIVVSSLFGVVARGLVFMNEVTIWSLKSEINNYFDFGETLAALSICSPFYG